MMGVFIFTMVVTAILLLFLTATLFGGLLVMWAWNLVAPLLWHAAPILTFWQGVAVAVLLQIIGNLFKITINNNGGSK